MGAGVESRSHLLSVPAPTCLRRNRKARVLAASHKGLCRGACKGSDVWAKLHGFLDARFPIRGHGPQPVEQQDFRGLLGARSLCHLASLSERSNGLEPDSIGTFELARARCRGGSHESLVCLVRARVLLFRPLPADVRRAQVPSSPVSSTVRCLCIVNTPVAPPFSSEADWAGLSLW